MSRIRTGLINCDLHAMYYGALMSKHDPIALRDDEVGRGHAAYFYFYTHYNEPQTIMVPTVQDFELVNVWDRDPALAENVSRIWDDHPKVCDSYEQVSDDVDLVFIGDCNGDGEDHLELARPGLEKGVPTFVDKPFAYELKDAEEIVRLALLNDTPVMSLSMPREVPHSKQFRDRFAELRAPEFGVIKGTGETLAAHIHAISLAQYLFGSGVESVECMGQSPLAYVHLDYGGKPGRPSAGVMIHCASGGMPHCAMYASAYSKQGAIHSPAIGDFVFPLGAANVLRKIKRMVSTGQPKSLTKR